MDLIEELLTCLFFIVIFAAQERTFTDLSNSWALCRIVGEQAYNQLFETRRKVSALDCLEVFVVTFVLNHAVILALENLGAMREPTMHHDEEENSH